MVSLDKFDEMKYICCPTCGEPAIRLIGMPSIYGKDCSKNSFHGHSHKVDIRNPDPYNDCKTQFHALECKGLMTPEMRAMAKNKMANLEEQKAKGIIRKFDWDKEGGHPLQKNDLPDKMGIEFRNISKEQAISEGMDLS